MKGLPRLWSGSRRLQLVVLVLLGLGQAVSAGAGAHLIVRAMHGSASRSPGTLFSVLIGAAIAVGVLRALERVWTERLSQHYVHEIRLGLLRFILANGRTSSLGVAMTRASNDLASVRNWVAMGVAPLIVGVPIIAGSLVALGFVDPWYSVAVLLPIIALTLVLIVLRGATYTRTRELRRRRGGLAQRVADTVLAAPLIRVSGGGQRELDRIGDASLALKDAAVHRSKVAGVLRGAATTATGLGTAAVIYVGLTRHLPAANTTAALAILAFLVAPVHDLGRITEYRQTYLAARTMLTPAILQEQSAPGGGSEVSGEPGLRAGVLWTRGGIALPPLSAAPGERVVVRAPSASACSEALLMLTGQDLAFPGDVRVEGVSLIDSSPTVVRTRLGYAAQGLALVRGSMQRNLRYRMPNAADEQVTELVRAVGLDRGLAMLPDGAATRIRHGGEPLATADRARVQLVRAMLGSPPLLVLDRIDNDLGADGIRLLRSLLADYPGVVVIASDTADSIVEPTQFWDITAAYAAPNWPSLIKQPTN